MTTFRRRPRRSRAAAASRAAVDTPTPTDVDAADAHAAAKAVDAGVVATDHADVAVAAIDVTNTTPSPSTLGLRLRPGVKHGVDSVGVRAVPSFSWSDADWWEVNDWRQTYRGPSRGMRCESWQARQSYALLEPRLVVLTRPKSYEPPTVQLEVELPKAGEAERKVGVVSWRLFMWKAHRLMWHMLPATMQPKAQGVDDVWRWVSICRIDVAFDFPARYALLEEWRHVPRLQARKPPERKVRTKGINAGISLIWKSEGEWSVSLYCNGKPNADGMVQMRCEVRLLREEAKRAMAEMPGGREFSVTGGQGGQREGKCLDEVLLTRRALEILARVSPPRAVLHAPVPEQFVGMLPNMTLEQMQAWVVRCSKRQQQERRMAVRNHLRARATSIYDLIVQPPPKPRPKPTPKKAQPVKEQPVKSKPKAKPMLRRMAMGKGKRS